MPMLLHSAQSSEIPNMICQDSIYRDWVYSAEIGFIECGLVKPCDYNLPVSQLHRMSKASYRKEGNIDGSMVRKKASVFHQGSQCNEVADLYMNPFVEH
jgi:hypothetical protein